MRPSGPSNKGRKGTPQDGSAWLPKGYSVEAEGENLLLLRRADGAVAAYAFSAFSPTPETLREAAEEDLRRGLRRDLGGVSEGANGKGGRGG